jgi:hypothetical protein
MYIYIYIFICIYNIHNHYHYIVTVIIIIMIIISIINIIRSCVIYPPTPYYPTVSTLINMSVQRALKNDLNRTKHVSFDNDGNDNNHNHTSENDDKVTDIRVKDGNQVNTIPLIYIYIYTYLHIFMYVYAETLKKMMIQKLALKMMKKWISYIIAYL